jgi:lipopolysaccharide cholinephosphotransferase
MKTIEEKELKQIQLDILNDITSFCEKNGLRYFLAYGTLLGAVRHKGYIPWDDDIDIHMPRPDYEKFLSLYSSRDNCAVTHENERCYHVPFAKVYRKGTVVKEYFYKPSVFGVYVDIFPLDGIRHRWQAFWCGQCIRFMYIKTFVFCDRQSFARKLRIAATKLILLPFTEHFILDTIRRISTRYRYDECGHVCSFGSRTAVREILPREVFEEYTMMPFEGKEYRVPKKYDVYLEHKYGEYMKLPPKDKQVSTHDSQAYHI